MLRIRWFGTKLMICLKEHCRQQRETLELMKIWRKYGTEWNDKATTLEEGLTNLELQMMGQIDKCYEMGLKKCGEFTFTCLIENHKKVDLPMSEESVNAPIPIIDLVSDGEMEKTLWEEVAKIDKRTTLTRKRLADAERRMTNILKPSDRISGFENHTRRPANNNKQLTQKGKDKMETSLSGESVGSSLNMSTINHGSSMKKEILTETVARTGLQAQTREGNLQGNAKRPIFLRVFHHQCCFRVDSCSYLHEALRAREVLHLIDERPPECILANSHKICDYHAGQPDHTTDECLDLKARLCMMIDDGKITQWGGSHTTTA
ncbi:hypothetical protein HAX54_003714 [Datura stramonium]|uniref:C3H1-type domain-containing protein n=1 Tax=Datura stramonium TaxID=4076 RepID=A0ABS8T6Z4_DATST|nr:hypothetical protein [Datura stramonium]